MALNFTLVRSFWHVAQAGSIAGAAQTRFISQPALSKAVRELEKQLGVALFERGARGVTLTAAGATLFEYAQAIFALEKEAEDALSALQSLNAGTLRIGASTTIATAILPPLLVDFRIQNPLLRFSLARGNTSQIEAQLLAFELDVALVEGPPHHEKIKKTFWREEELIVICAPSHPLAARRLVSWDEIKERDWIAREVGSGTREVVENALQSWGGAPTPILEVSGSETLRQAVAAGLGLAFASRESATDQLALGKLRVLQVENLVLRRPFYFLHLENRPLSSAARAFERFLTPDA